MRRALLAAWGVAALLLSASPARAAAQFQQSTDAAFDAGTYSSTYRSGSGSAVSVQLAYTGQGAGLALPGGVPWFNAAWSYRVPVNIQSTNASTLTNYQVPVTLNTQTPISAGRMQAGGADMRFTAADGVTPVNFYLLSGINTASTLVWVQVPSVAASTTTTLYMYYGNASTTTASNLAATFLFGDDFSAANGTPPNAAKWSSIYTSSTTGSSQATEGGLMQYSYGSSLSSGYSGLASVNSLSYASGVRYQFVIDGETIGAGQKSAINLCTQASDCFSTLGFGSAKWLGFTITHSTPAYTLQSAAGSGVNTIVANTSTSAGAHTVDFLMKPGAYQVTLDGASIASGALATLTPYIQLEAGSNSSALKNFLFGTVLVTQYSTPEPTLAGVGAEQGAYAPAGTYASAVLDSGVSGTRYSLGDWQASIPGAAGLGFTARAADSSIAAGTWTAVSAGADTGLSGRYFQYQSSFTTTDARFTAAVSSVTFAYTSAPPAPTAFAGTAVSSVALSWSWTDAGAGQFQPDGFNVLNATGGALAALGPGQLSWTETPLTPNTSYQTEVQAYNFVGSSATALVAQYTLTPPAAISAAQSTGTWYGAGTTFAFTNLAGFGPGAVASYRYAWTPSASYAFGGSEPTWSAGVLSISTGASGQYYLHALPLNAVGAAAAQLDFGPFLFDLVPPAVTGFSPSSSSWTSAAASVNVGLSDAGGSGLAGVQYQWLSSSSTPAGGWSALDTSVTGSSASINRIQFANGVSYLHILVTNIAGTTGYAESGPYEVDVSSPTGSLSINGGAAFTSTTTVALSLTYDDSVSGVAAVRYSNVPGTFTAYQLPTSTLSWQLAGGVGVSTVEYQIVDFASNTATYLASITYSSQTALSLGGVTLAASGATPAQVSTVTLTAVLAPALGGGGLSGEPVAFSAFSASGAATTNGSGSASISFAAPSSSGVYLASAAFSGDSSYAASAATATVTVLQRSSFLVAPGVAANASSTVTISVTLLDLATTVGLSSTTVSISFQGSTVAATTDASGAASASFGAPASSGAFAYAASYAGGATYAPVASGGTVTVGRRGVLIVGGGYAASIDQPFPASATLYDSITGGRLAGETLVFELAGSSATGVTNSSGVATGTLVAASTGSPNEVVTFEGDATYAVGSDTETGTVGLRPTADAAVVVSTSVNSSFTASVVVTDTLGGSPLVGDLVTFTFLAASATVATDASGSAQASFTAPPSSGSYSYSVADSGGPLNAPGSAVAAVTVVRRVSSAAVLSFSAGASSVFTATATLTDFATGAPLAGEAFDFQFQGATAAVTTDASGTAVAVFTAPGITGGYPLVGTFTGDGTYLPSSSTGTVNVNTIATTLTGVNVSVPESGVFTASATLVQTSNLAPISGRTVLLTFQGNTTPVVTNAAGFVSAAFTAPASSGTFNLNADYLGDSLYVASSATNTVSATQRPLTIAPSAETSAAGDVWTATATVDDILSGQPVPGLALQLTFQSVVSTSVSGGTGVSVATFTAPASSGTYAWQASYPGDAVYSAASAGGVLVVSLRLSQTAAQAVTAVTNRVFTASATVTDYETGNPLGGKTVSFSFQASTLTAVTDGAGLATRTFLAPSSSGSYSCSAWFSGDSSAASSTGTATVTVIRLPSALAGQDVTTTANASFNPQETLTDAGSGQPLSGETVNFTFMSATMAVVTDAFGVAVATFTAPSSSQLTSFSASFAGDATYAPANDSRVVAVGFRNTVSVPFNASGLALDPSTFTAKLIDAVSLSALSGETMSLNLQATTNTAVTDVNGLAVSTFTLPASSGTYAFDASFAGQGFYVASAATATITVLTRPTVMFGSLADNDLDRFATLGAYNGGWELEDSNNTLGVSGRAINVYYHSSTTTVTSTYTVTTNASGNFNLSSLNLQTSSFTSTGILNLAFAGDATYSSATIVVPFTVVPRYTNINVDGPTANAGLPFTVGATLNDDFIGPIAAQTITFTFQGSTAAGTTNASGFATASFAAPYSTGPYSVTATYAGNSTYGASGGTGVVTVINRQSLLSNGGWDCGVMLACTIGSTLTDLSSGTAIVGATVTYYVGGGTYTALTNASGATSLTLPAFTAVGGQTVYSDFLGDGAFLPAYSTTTLPINLRPTLLGVADQQVQRLGVVSLAAGLQEYFFQNANVSGATVTFVFNGSTYTALTNSFGTAVATAAAPSALGAYPFSASFVGDSTFTAAANSANVIVGADDTQLSGSNVQPSFSQGFVASAQLQAGATPIAGATITFTLQGATQTAITDSLGVATAPFTAPASTGAYTMNLSYAGDALYNASTATASVQVVPRPTGLVANSLSTAVQSTFTASATLTDGVSGLPLSGAAVVFTYQGSSATALTDATGVATTTFVVPSTSAASYAATYGGSGIYDGSSSTGTLTVSLRTTSLIAFDQTPAVSQAFSVSAQLQDFASGNPIAGATVTFALQGATETAVTNASGQAAAVYTAPAASGTYAYTAYYPGSGVYLANTSTANVVVSQRGTALTPSAVNTAEDQVFSAQATFVDSVSGLPVAGATVTFVFQGSTFTAVTNASGVATSTFTAPASSGTYTYTASFPGDGTYTAANANASVNVGLRTTSLVVANVGVLIGDGWTASAELIDSASGLPVSTETISLLFAASTKTAATNGAGVAAVGFSSQPLSGAFPIYGSFAGDATYAPASGVGTLTVSSRTTSMALTLPNTYPGELFIATATLTDVETGVPIATQAVVLQFQASSAAIATNSLGQSAATFAATPSTGTFSLVGTFLSSGAYVGSSSTGSVSVLLRPTSLAVSPAAVVLSSSFTASAVLDDTRLGAGVSGEPVSFVFNGATQTVLSALGSATTTFAAPAAAGNYTLAAYFVGTSTLAAASNTANVNVTLRPTLTLGAPQATTASSPFTVTAQIKDATTSSSLSGQTLVFTFNGSSQAASTNGSGQASALFGAPASSGTVNFAVTYAGGAVYAASSDTEPVTVGQRAVAIALPNYGANALGPVVPAVTVTDVALAQGLSGVAVSFVFQGTTETNTTNGLGAATTNYIAPAGIGLYALTAATPGDATYAAAFASATVSVQSFSSTITANGATAFAGQVFVASATLLSSYNSAPIVGSSVVFQLQGSVQVATTTAVGLATATYTAPASSGAYAYSATFEGDGTYLGGSSTATLTVLPWATTLSAGATETVSALTVITASATLTRTLGAPPVAGRPVLFTFQGSNLSGTTNASGLATATFTAVSSGTWNYAASFAGDSANGPSSTSTAITVTGLASAMSLPPANTYALGVFTASATLTSLAGPVVGRTVLFYYLGTSSAASTDGTGFAAVNYSAGASSGTPSFTATFTGDATYGASSATNTVTVNPRPIALASPAAAVFAEDPLVVSATMTDTLAIQPVPAESIAFSYLGGSSTTLTNATGAAWATFNAGASSGSYTYYSTFTANATYLGGTASGSVAVLERPTALAAPSLTAGVSLPFVATATLTDVETGGPVSGQSVIFVYMASSFTAPTNGLGIATATFMAPAAPVVNSFSATLSSGPTYGGVSSTGTVNVVLRPSSLAAVAVPQVYAAAAFIATATLTDQSNGNPLPGRTVSFLYLGTSSSSLTNASGLGTATYAAGGSSGPYTYNATFAGDAQYAAQSSTVAVAVLPRPTNVAGVAVPSVYANNVFTASAALTDVITSSNVGNQTLTFAYPPSGSSASLTNAAGFGDVTFNAGPSSGPYQYTVTLASGPEYSGVSAAANVTVAQRPVSLIVQTTTTFTLTTFITSATLSDQLNGGGIAAQLLWFNYGGSWQSATTNSSGTAVFSYASGASSGPYAYSATLVPTATYQGISSSATVTVNPRPTTMSAPGAAAYSLGVFTASATLTDSQTSGGISGKTVKFVYLGSTQTAVTSALGLATTVYAVGPSSGSYSYSATYTGDPTYLGSSSGPVVAVSPRPMALSAPAVATYVNQVFTASATLTDVLSGQTVSGQSVSFLYFGASSSSLTNANGLATVTYNSGLSSGTWSFSVTLSSGPTYAGVSSTASVVANPRPTALAATAVPQVLANGLFTASATLTDVYGGNSPIAGRTVTFLYQGGSSSSSLTNASGLATVTYNSGNSSGTYSYSATYLGEAEYAAQSATASVVVSPRATEIVAQAAGPLFTLSVFTASSTLEDVAAGNAPIPNQTLSFLFQGTSSASLTNAAGLGTVTFNAGTASGTWTYSTTLSSGALYAGVSSTATVTINPRSTTLLAQTTAEYTLNTFIASATLRDGINNNPISGQLVWFNYGGNQQSAATNGAGLATHVYSVGIGSGTFQYSATFLPTPTYTGQSSTGTLTANPRPTTLAAPGAAVYSSATFNASATLTDGQTLGGISGRTVTFYYLGSSQTAVTNGLGQATTAYAAGTSSGSYAYSATYAADATYVGSSSAPAVVVSPRPTGIAAPAATTIVDGVFTASGTLTDVLGSSQLPGKTLYFQYGGSSAAATTNGAGLATALFGAGASSGPYVYSVTLSSGPTYAGVSSTAAVTVTPRPTTLAANAVASVAAEDLFVATATLKDQGTGAPIAGEAVTFLYQGGSSSSSLTDAAGLATVSYSAGASSGPFTYTATFTGDAVYAVQSATAAVTVVQRPTSVAASPAAVFAAESYISSATLTDVELSAGLPGRTLDFVYVVASSSSLTNASGLGTATYAAGTSSGVYSFSATLPQSPTYAFASSTANVTVLPRPTLVAAAAVASVNTNSVFTASATLDDVRLGGALSGQTVYFQYLGSSGAATTNGAGLATALFGAGTSSGTLSFSATLSSGPEYAGQSSTASVTVIQRASVLVSTPIASVPALGVFLASATLNDASTGAPIPGKTISFSYFGAQQTAVTNALGSGTTNYAAGPSSGSYQYSATYVQDATYLGSSSTSAVTVTPRPTLAAALAATAPAASVFTASATLTDVLGSSALPGQNLWFNFGGASSASLTNGAGLATVTYAVPASSGAYQFSVTLSSGPTYAGQSSTATLTVTQRATLLPSLPVASVYVNAVFTATATLSDAATSGALAGKTVSFLYLGTSSSSLTNALGQATVSYSAGASSGTPSYSATFVGDAEYAPQSSTSAVTVLPRPTSTTVYGVASVYVNAVFTATATVSDLVGGGGVSGQTVSFVYRGTQQSAATAASGQATWTFNAGASSGPFSYSATLSSGPAYGFSSATAAVSVVQRPINVAALATTGYVNAVFIASATLTDGLSLTPAVGYPVTFLYQGVSSTSLTNAGGVATVSYAAGASSGAPTFSATYVPDAVYAGGSSTATVTVDPRPTSLAALPVGSTPAISPFSAAATLTDGLGAGPIMGQTLWFVFEGGISSAATNASGTASTNFSAGTSSGTYPFSATLSSGSVYAGVSSTANVTVTPRATTLSMPALGSVVTLNVFVASATLLDASALTPISGQTVSFVFNGSTVTGLSNAAGLSTAAFTAPSSSGTLAVTAALAADGTYLASAASTTVTMAARLTTLTAQPATVYALETFVASTTLIDQLTSGPIAGRSVSNLFQAASATGTTSAAGLSTAAFTAPASSGAYSDSSSFAGDATYGYSNAGAAVTVLARPTGLGVAAPAAAYAETVFTATATLTDLRAAGPAVGRTVSFVYRGSTSAAVTDASGVAVATFTAGVSTGTYGLSTTFAGDALYASSAAAVVSIAVAPRPTALAAAAVPSVYALGVFAATATLTDAISTAPIAGLSVVFSYEGSSGTATTDVGGAAAVLFAAGASTGPQSYSATFLPNATYAGTSSTAAATVAPRPTSILAVSATAYASTVFTASATLTDAPSGAGLAGKTLSFVFAGSTQTAATDASGFAASTFTAPSSSGAYALAVSVSTDSIYVGSVSTATITVIRQPSVDTLAPVTADALSVFTASATLTDGLSTATLSGESVSFVFQGATQTALTNGLGLATTTFFAPAVAGGYPLTSAFAGDSVYSASAGSETMIVSPRPSAAAAVPATVPALDVFSGTATITDAALGTPISGGAVSFFFLASTNSGTTNGSGVAASTFSAPASSGVYAYVAQYQGSATYLSTSAPAAVTVTQRTTAVSVSSETAYVLSVFTATATLLDVETGGPLSGQALSFVINGTTVVATTNGSGAAFASFTAPASSGAYSVSAGLAPTATYAASVAASTLTVVTRPSQLSTGTASGAALDPMSVAATLIDPLSGSPLAGRTVSFVLFGATQTALTGGLGQAATTYAAPAASGTYVLEAIFAGDASYSSTTIYGSAAVLARGTKMTAASLTTIANSVFTATGTLSDTETSAALSGKTVHLHFSDGGPGVDAYPTTDAFGNAAATFTAPSGTGLFSYTATFSGDQTYGVSLATGFVQIGLASTLIAADISTIELDTFTFTAKLVDPFSQPISSRTISFTFNGSTQSAATNGAGVASSTFTAPASSGVYAGAAAFAGDATYAGSGANVNVNVSQRGTTLTAATGVSATVGSSVTVTARLRDNETSLGISTKTVVFTMFGSTLSAASNATGVAAAVFPPAASSGTYPLAVAFAGDSIYAAAADSSTVAVTLIPTSPVPLPTSGSPSAPVTLTLSLVSLADGSSLPGKAVSFQLGASTAAAVTNASGQASASFTAPSSSGVYNYQTLFAGDTTYAPSASTGTLAVGLRATALALVVPPSSANAVVTASATLTDVLSSTGVPAETIVFTFGASTASAAANAYGVALATFAAPASTGAFALSAAFAGDATYAPSSAAASVPISLRPVAAAVPAVTATVGAVFVATATFSDALTGAPVSSAAVVFQLLGTTVAATTDGLGTATAAFTAPASSGAYALSASFAGAGLEAPASATGTVTAAQLASLITFAPVSTYLDASFTASASLLAQASGAPIPGESLQFAFQGSTASAVTNALGVASATFMAPGVLGVYTASAAYAGGATYGSFFAVAAVSLSSRPTAMTLPLVDASALQVFTATITLVDVPSGQLLPGATVSFFFQGSTAAAVTNGAGVALATFTAPGSTGTYELDGLFAGTTVYLSTGAFSSVVISSGGGSGGTGGSGGGQGTVLTAPDLSVVVSNVFVASATLTLTPVGLGTGAPVPGETVSFYFSGTTVTAITNVVGLASAAFTAPATSGTVIMAESFAGDSTFNAASSTSSVFVLPAPTVLTVPDVLTSSGSIFVATATLTVASSSAPLAARSVQFLFQGTTVAAATNGSGAAYATFFAPTSSGSYVLFASFAGDPVYAVASASAAVVVQASGGGGGTTNGSGGGASVLIKFAAPVTPAVASAVFTAEATLFDPTLSQGVPGRTLAFVFQGSTSTAQTDAFGVAQATFTAPATYGPYPLSAYFVGDSTYVAVSATDTVVAGLGLVPADPMNLAVTTQTPTNILIGWNPVSLSVNGVYLSSEVVRYEIDLTTTIGTGWTAFTSVSSGQPTALNLSTAAVNNWLRVVAISREGYRSPGQSALHVTNYASPARVFLAANEAAWVEVPPDANQALSACGVNCSISVSSISAPGFVFAYDLSVFNGSSYDHNFSFGNSYNGVTFVVSIPAAQAAQGASAAAYRPKDNGELGLYFFNGVQWVLLGGAENVQSGQVSIDLKRTGEFATGYTTLAGNFSLTLVAPRVFTPQKCMPSPSALTCATWTFQNPDNSPINIRIFDVTGKQVRSTVSGQFSSSQLYWDGTDSSGKIVRTGVYIYQIETGGKSTTGTIAVAY